MTDCERDGKELEETADGSTANFYAMQPDDTEKLTPLRLHAASGGAILERREPSRVTRRIQGLS